MRKAFQSVAQLVLTVAGGTIGLSPTDAAIIQRSNISSPLSRALYTESDQEKRLKEIVAQCNAFTDETTEQIRFIKGAATTITNIKKPKESKIREYIGGAPILAEIAELRQSLGDQQFKKIIYAQSNGTKIFSIMRQKLQIPNPPESQPRIKKLRVSRHNTPKPKQLETAAQKTPAVVRTPIAAKIFTAADYMRPIESARDDFLRSVGRQGYLSAQKIHLLSLAIQKLEDPKSKTAAFNRSGKWAQLTEGTVNRWISRKRLLRRATDKRAMAIADMAEIIRANNICCGYGAIKRAVGAGIDFNRTGLLPSDPFYYVLLFKFPEYIPNWFELDIPKIKTRVKPKRLSKSERLMLRREESGFFPEESNIPGTVTSAPIAREPAKIIDEQTIPVRTKFKGGDIEALVAHLDSQPPVDMVGKNIISGAVNRVKATRIEACKKALMPVVQKNKPDPFFAPDPPTAQELQDAAVRAKLLADHLAKTQSKT